jgi:membrane protease YdiL (CAAX protease family)
MLDSEPVQVVPPERKPTVSWRLFWLLALAVLLAALLVLPYALQILLAGKPELTRQYSTLRTSATLNAVLQAVFLYWPLMLLGLVTAGRLGLGLPFLSRWLEGRRSVEDGKPSLRRALTVSAWLGFGTGMATLVASALLSPLTAGELIRLNASLPKSALPNAWQGFLGAISAGINEEILLRLFLLSGLAWLIQWIFTRRTSGRPGRRVLWAANILAAVTFGLLHLPNLSALNVPFSPYLLALIVTLNGAAGLAFGWLYWTFGLESAILAHFYMDIVLHVLTVPLQALAH